MKRNIFLITIFLLIHNVAMTQPIDNVIESGSVVNIVVMGYPELSMSTIVRSDGTTDYPLLINIPIDGMTTGEVSDILLPVLKRLVENPRVYINILDYKVLDIRIIGAVKAPGNFEIKSPIDIQGALAYAGGPTEEADLRNVTVIHHGTEGGSPEIIDILQTIADGSNLFQLYEMQDEDLIVVPSLSRDAVAKVIGLVNLPGSYVPVNGENIAEFIYRAGGPKREGDMKKVIYYSQGKLQQEINIFKMLKEGNQDELPIVQPGDIIVINEKNEYLTFSFYARLLRDAAYVLSGIVILSRL